MVTKDDSFMPEYWPGDLVKTKEHEKAKVVKVDEESGILLVETPDGFQHTVPSKDVVELLDFAFPPEDEEGEQLTFGFGNKGSAPPAPVKHVHCDVLELPTKGKLYLSSSGSTPPDDRNITVYLDHSRIPRNHWYAGNHDSSGDAIVAEMLSNDGGVFHTYIPWPDMGVVSIELFERASRTIETWLAYGLNVEIGCIGGHGRTGTLAAGVMLVAFKYTADQAIERIREVYCDKAVESKRQEDLLDEFAAKLGRK